MNTRQRCVTLSAIQQASLSLTLLQKDTLVNEVHSLSEQVTSLTASMQSAEGKSASHVAEMDDIRAKLAAEQAKLASSSSDLAVLPALRAELEKTKSDLAAAESQSKTAAETEKSLRDKIAAMEKELETAKGPPVGKKLKNQVDKLEKEAKEKDDKLKTLQDELDQEKKAREEDGKEHEDLLVLLEELSTKRKRDKAKMKEKGMDVSEGEDEDGEDEADE